MKNIKFADYVKRYNHTIPKYRHKRGRKVKKSNHKHEYTLLRAYECNYWGNRPTVYYTVVGKCNHCDKLIRGDDLLVEQGYAEKYCWFRQIDFSKYDFPIIYTKVGRGMTPYQIIDKDELEEAYLLVKEDTKRRLERS